MQTRRGFTLIELMIVVAIIAIVAAIGIPNLIRARIATNEAAAIGNLRTIHSAQSAFKLSTALDVNGNGAGEYAALANLSAGNPGFLDVALGTGTRLGYLFSVELGGAPVTDEVQWAASAWPIFPGGSGVRSFYIDETGILRAANNGGVRGLRAVGTNWAPVSS